MNNRLTPPLALSRVVPAMLLLGFLASISGNASARSNSEAAANHNAVLPMADGAVENHYLTHDNGNYHRYHFNNTQQHSQPDRRITEGRQPTLRSCNRDAKYRRHFRRHQRFPSGAFTHRGLTYNGGFGHFDNSHNNRRFINSVIGGAILYRLFK